MAKYPLFLEMKDRPAVVIGGGSIALQKTKALLDTGAKLSIVAPDICACLEALCEQNDIPFYKETYQTKHIEEAILVIAATDDRRVNEAVFNDCRERRILCNVVDVPDLCDFYVPAIVRRGVLQIAIGTEGYSPAFAGQVRRQLEEQFTETHGEFLNHLRQQRKVVINKVEEPKRKDVLVAMAQPDSYKIFAEQGVAAWQQYAQTLIDKTLEP